MAITVSIKDLIPRIPELRFSEPINWTLEEGQQWAIIGPNGAGKTLLADFLQRRHAIKEGKVEYGLDGKTNELIRSIAFKDIYSLTDSRNAYYQQRWHSFETDAAPVVEDLLATEDKERLHQLLSCFHLETALSKRIISLSSGELRKFLIIRTLLSSPRILILDNPFIGLDVDSRRLLVEMLEQLTMFDGLQIILLLSNPADIPAMITHVLPVTGRNCREPQTREQFLADKATQSILFPDRVLYNNVVLPTADGTEASTHEVTFWMENVIIRYGERVILKDLNWEVRNGEKWSLTGPNGSGKSTLLSLVYADNPQAYANTIYLFDRKRGSGESIWDIKKRIGYVSPEMHLYYQENVPAAEIVGSGFFDSIGLHRRCNEIQQTVAIEWMKTMEIEHLKDRLFMTLSSGEQRLVLLARAFVKNPDLLVLDEPLHGLDISHKKLAAAVIERFCEQAGKTLIYVTHYPEELPGCVDRHYRLKAER